MEDVDVSFSMQKRELDNATPVSNQQRFGMRHGGPGAVVPPSSNQLSLSSILNAIDGVEANEGR